MIFNRNGSDFSIKLYFFFFSIRTTQPYCYFIKKDKVSGHTNKLPQFYLSLPLLLTILVHKMMFSKSSEAGRGGVLLN